MLISRLLSWFTPRVLKDHASAPAIKGHVTIDTFEGGKRRQHVEGSNIWTLTGREYLAELIALKAISGDTFFRNDRIAFVGVGAGSQPEVANIPELVAPVPYAPGEFLARLKVPATFPVLSETSSRTGVRFVREFGLNEISLGSNTILTEAGLFTNGDPDDNWSTSATPTGFSATYDRAPMAYKTFEPVTKTTSFTLRLIWEVRFL
jgi:hypothetical protein